MTTICPTLLVSTCPVQTFCPPVDTKPCAVNVDDYVLIIDDEKKYLCEFCSENGAYVICEPNCDYKLIIDEVGNLFLKLPTSLICHINDCNFTEMILLLGVDNLLFGCFDIFEFKTPCIGNYSNIPFFPSLTITKEEVLTIPDIECIKIYSCLTEKEIECIKTFYCIPNNDNCYQTEPANNFFTDNPLFTFTTFTQTIEIDITEFCFEKDGGKNIYVLSEEPCKYKFEYKEGQIILHIPNSCYDHIKLKISNDVIPDCCDKLLNPDIGYIELENDCVFLVINNVTVDCNQLVLFSDLTTSELKCLKNTLTNFFFFEYSIFGKIFEISEYEFCKENDCILGLPLECEYKFVIDRENGDLIIEFPNIAPQDIRILIGENNLFFNCFNELVDPNKGVIVYELDNIFIQISEEELSNCCLTEPLTTPVCSECVIEKIILFSNLDNELMDGIRNYYIDPELVITNICGEDILLINFCCEIFRGITTYTLEIETYLLQITENKLILKTPKGLNLTKLKLIIGTNGKFFDVFNTFFIINHEPKNGSIITKLDGTILYCVEQITECVDLFCDLTKMEIECIKQFYNTTQFVNNIVLEIGFFCDDTQFITLDSFYSETVDNEKTYVLCDDKYEIIIDGDELKIKVPPHLKNIIKNLTILIGKNDLIYDCFNLLEYNNIIKGIIKTVVVNNELQYSLFIEDIIINPVCITEPVLATLTIFDIECITAFYNDENNRILQFETMNSKIIIPDNVCFNTDKFVVSVKNNSLFLTIPDCLLNETGFECLEFLIGNNDLYFGIYVDFKEPLVGEEIKTLNQEIFFKITDITAKIELYDNLTEEEIEHILSFFNNNNNIEYTIYGKIIEDVLCVDEEDKYKILIEDDELILKVPPEIINNDLKYVEVVIGNDLYFNCFEEFITQNVGEIIIEDGIMKIKVSIDEIVNECIVLFTGLTCSQINSIKCFYLDYDNILVCITTCKVIKNEEPIYPYEKTDIVDVCLGFERPEICNLFIEDGKLILEILREFEEQIKLVIGTNGKYFNCFENLEQNVGEVIINGDEICLLIEEQSEEQGEKQNEIYELFINLTDQQIMEIMNYYNGLIETVVEIDDETKPLNVLFTKGCNLIIKGGQVSITFPSEVIDKIECADVKCIELLIGFDKLFDCCLDFNNLENGNIVYRENVYIKFENDIENDIVNNIESTMVLYSNLNTTQIECIKNFYANLENNIILKCESLSCKIVEYDEICISCDLPQYKLEIVNNDLLLKIPFENKQLTIEFLIGINNKIFNCFNIFKNQEIGDVVNYVNGKITLLLETVENCIILYSNLSIKEIECIKCFFIQDNIELKINSLCTVYNITFEDFCSEFFNNKVTYAIGGYCSYKLEIVNNELLLKLPYEGIEQIELLIGNNDTFFNCCSTFKKQNIGVIITDGNKYININNPDKCVKLFTDLTVDEIDCIKCFYTLGIESFLNIVFNKCVERQIPVELFCCEDYNDKITYALGGNVPMYRLTIEDDKLLLKIPSKLVECIEKIELLIGDGGCKDMVEVNTGGLIVKSDGLVTICITDISSCIDLFNITDIEQLRDFYTNFEGSILKIDGIPIPPENVNLDDILCNYEIIITDNSLKLVIPSSNIDKIEFIIGTDNKYFGKYDCFCISDIGCTITDNKGDIKIVIENIDDNCFILFDDLGETDSIKDFYNNYEGVLLKSKSSCIEKDISIGEFCITVDCCQKLTLENNSLIFKYVGTLKLIIGTNSKIFNTYSTFKHKNGIISFEKRGLVFLIVVDEEVLFEGLSIDVMTVIKQFYSTSFENSGFKNVRDTVLYINGESIILEQLCKETFDETCTYVLGGVSCNYKLILESGNLQFCFPNDNFNNVNILIGRNNKYFGIFEDFEKPLNGNVIIDEEQNIYVRITEYDETCLILFTNLEEEITCIINDFYTVKETDIIANVEENVSCGNAEIIQIPSTMFCNGDSICKSKMCCSNICEVKTNILISPSDKKYKMKIDGCNLNLVTMENISSIEIIVGLNNKLFDCDFNGKPRGTIITNTNGVQRMIIENIYNKCTSLFTDITLLDKCCVKTFYSDNYFDADNIILNDIAIGDFCKEGCTYVLGGDINYNLEIIDNKLVLTMPLQIDDFKYVELIVGKDNVFFNCFTNFKVQKDGILISNTNGVKIIRITELDKNCFIIYDELSLEEIDCIKYFYNGNIALKINGCKEIILPPLEQQTDYEFIIENNDFILIHPLKTKCLELLIGHNGNTFSNCFSTGFVLTRDNGDVVLKIVGDDNLSNRITLVKCACNVVVENIKKFYSIAKDGGFNRKIDTVLKLINGKNISLEKFKTIDKINYVFEKKNVIKIDNGNLILVMNIDDIHFNSLELVVGENGKLFNCNIDFPEPNLGTFISENGKIILKINRLNDLVLFMGLTNKQQKVISNFYGTVTVKINYNNLKPSKNIVVNNLICIK